MSALAQIHRPPVAVDRLPPRDALPSSVLYATSARFGGTGLDSTSLEGVLASHRAGILGMGIAYQNRQCEVPGDRVLSLRASPVRLLSFLPSQRYYAAKKKFVDRVSACVLSRGRFDCFHGWSGDALRTLIAARQRGIPSLLDIPTWHRNKGKRKPFVTRSEREARAARGIAAAARRAFDIDRQRMLLEYELADVILVPSERAAETFLDVGVDPGKLVYVARGVDVDRFTPASPPPLFRLTFVGALIRRKGVHHLLEAWHRLRLKDAELVLVGTPHREIQPWLDRFASPTVRVTGFTRDVHRHLRESSAFAFPSECEGAAKAVFEAAATALPLIATRESGDVVVDGENGIIVPPNDPDALAEAIRHLHGHPELLAEMGRRARERVVRHFTWDHYRARLVHAYACARAVGREVPAAP